MSDFIVAVDIGGTKIALATADFEGHLLHTAQICTDVDGGAQQALRRAAECALMLMARTREHDAARACHGFAVVAPGVVQGGGMTLAPNLPGLDHVDVRGLLEGELTVPCLSMGNDVKAAALAEARWGSLRRCDPALFVNLGTGLAAAIVVAGRVVSGAHDAAGEMAYLLDRLSGHAGASAGRAPLEEMVGGRAIAERASALVGAAVTTAEAFTHPDPRVGLLVDDALDALSLHIANAAILLDPARIALGGGLMGSARHVLEVVTRRVESAVPFPPEVVPATFLRDAPLRGAVALAIDSLDAPVPA